MPLQSVVVVQLVLQLLVLHPYGTQDWVDGVAHVPLALHVAFGVSVEPVQLAGTQTVPVA